LLFILEHSLILLNDLEVLNPNELISIISDSESKLLNDRLTTENINTLLHFLQNNEITYDVTFLKKNKYIPIIELFNYEDIDILDESINIYNTHNKYLQELNLEKVWLENMDNRILLMTKAKIAIREKKNELARIIFEHLISVYPRYALGYYYLAKILHEEKSAYNSLFSKKYVRIAYDLYPHYSNLLSRISDLYDQIIFENKEKYE